MDTIAHQFRQALRSLLRAPGFLATAVLTLALGVGATTAMFAALNAVVLSPLPYPEPERLVRLENRVPVLDPARNFALSPAQYFHHREDSRGLEDLGIYTTPRMSLTGEASAERVQAAQITASVLSVLRARPALGRLITPQDETPSSTGTGNVLPGPAVPVAVLGYDFWVRRYGADPGMVGRTIEMEGTTIPVVGVLARGVDLPDAGIDVDVWLPMGLNPAARPTNWHGFQAVGRLRPGATIATLQGELEEAVGRFTELYPSAYSEPFMEATGFSPVVIPLREAVVGDLGRTLWVLLSAVGLVLLIATANVANLFLVRTEGRQREMAIRSSVGATRGHLARQFLSEGVILAVLSGALGLMLAHVGVGALVAAAPEGLPRVEAIQVDGIAIGFAALVALVVGTGVGIIPLLRLGDRTTAGSLREAGRGLTAGRDRNTARNLLVVGQVAMALVLLASAGLLLQSYQRLRAVDAGVDPRGVLTMELTLPYARYPGYPQASAFHQALLERIESLPGVQAAGFTTDLPLASEDLCSAVFPETGPARVEGDPPCVPVSLVAPGFFRALGIPVEGRVPTWGDVNDGTGAVVVSRALADRLWPGEDPIGEGIRANGNQEPYYRVVGVSADVRYHGLDEAPAEMVYFPPVPIEGAPLWTPLFAGTLVVRAANDPPAGLTEAIRALVAELDPEVPISNVRTMDEVVAASMTRRTFAMLLLGISAAFALALSAVGLYGVVSYVVGQRRKEIGIRMALGARMEEVASLILRHSLKLVVAGVGIGLVVASVATRVLQSLLFEVDPTDPIVLGGTSLLLITVALLASYLPARRAVRVDPVIALRSE